MTNHALTGRAFDIDLGAFVPRLTFLDDDQMRVEAVIGDVAVNEVVRFDRAELRPNVFMVGWTESSGTFVVQVQDHETGTVHNHARLPDGQVFRAAGTIKEYAA